MLECERDKQEAVLTLRNITQEEVEEQARALQCDIKILPMSLEDIYRMVVGE